jgi:hypothetical protein
VSVEHIRAWCGGAEGMWALMPFMCSMRWHAPP